MRFVLTCGGTAGHINPALAVAGRLRELLPDSEFLFLGAEGKMEMDLVPRAGYEIRGLKITNISRGHSLEALRHNLDTVKNVLGSEHEARRILKEFMPDAVIGTGGYVCYPVLTEAARLHIPTLVHESNAQPGLTTRMLARRVDAIMVGRATFGRPWIFKEIHDALFPDAPIDTTGIINSPHPPMSTDWKLDALKQQVLTSISHVRAPKAADERDREHRGILHSRRHIANSPIFKGIPNFRERRIAMLRAETADELFSLMEEARPLIQG